MNLLLGSICLILCFQMAQDRESQSGSSGDQQQQYDEEKKEEEKKEDKN